MQFYVAWNARQQFCDESSTFFQTLKYDSVKIRAEQPPKSSHTSENKEQDPGKRNYSLYPTLSSLSLPSPQNFSGFKVWCRSLDGAEQGEFCTG